MDERRKFTNITGVAGCITIIVTLVGILFVDNEPYTTVFLILSTLGMIITAVAATTLYIRVIHKEEEDPLIETV